MIFITHYNDHSRLLLARVLPKNIIDKIHKKFIKGELPGRSARYFTRAQGSLLYINWYAFWYNNNDLIIEEAYSGTDTIDLLKFIAEKHGIVILK